MAIPTAPTLTVNDTLPSRRKTKFTIGNPTWVMASLAGLYGNISGAVAREYTTNAADEHIKYGVKRPVEVTLPSAMNPFFTVRDFAYGMNEDVMHEVYTQFGTSTKHNSVDTNGMLGLGSKSAVAYTTQFTVTSICKGIKTIASINREPDYSIDLDTIHLGPSDEPSGTEIKIPVHNIQEFNHKAMDAFRFWTAGTLLVNGDEVVPQVGDKLDDNLYLSDDKSYVVMGNVGYPINNPSALFSKHGLNDIPFVAFVGPGEVEFVPSRESLKYDGPNTVATLERIVGNFAKTVKAKAQFEIKSAKNHYEAYLSWTNWTARLGYGVLSDLTYMGDALTNNIKVKARVYQTRGYGRSVYSTDEWPIDRLKNTIVVTDYTMSLGTPHKTKIRDWTRFRGLSTTYYLFVLGKVDSPWIDPNRTVSWDQVVTDVPNQKGGGNGGVRRIKGTFDYYTIDGFESEKAIPTGKDVYYIKIQDSKTWSEQKVLKALDWTNAVVVLLAGNRINKFSKDNPSAKDFIVEAQKMVNKNPSDLIPDYVKPAMAIDYTTERWLSVLDVNRIDDPAFADLAKAKAAKNGTVLDAYQKALTLANLCHMGYTIGAYSPTNYTDLTKGYPLLTQVNANRGLVNEIYFYINAKYHSKKGN